MSFSSCPVATVDAPIDQVWSLLANPVQYAQPMDVWAKKIAASQAVVYR